MYACRRNSSFLAQVTWLGGNGGVQIISGYSNVRFPERTQTDFRVDTRKTMDETIEIKIRNHKDEKVKVIVKENLYRRTTWEITQKSHPFEKIDSRTIRFPVEVDKDGEVTIKYAVHYSW